MKNIGKTFILLMIIVISCGTKEKKEEDVIVSIGTEKLTLKKLDREIPDFMKDSISKEQINNFIQQWIENELIYQGALKLGMDLEEDYRRDLERAKKNLLIKKYLDHYLQEEVEISDEEAFKYYESNKENFQVPEDQIHALHILLETKVEAEAARNRILQGEDFVKVAKELSIDYQKKGRIELDYFSRNDVVSDVAARIFSYRVGSVTRPIQSDFGYHIFKILDKREKGETISFEEAREKIDSRLKSKKKKILFQELITDLRKKIIVKKNEDVLKKLYSDSSVIRRNRPLN